MAAVPLEQLSDMLLPPCLWPFTKWYHAFFKEDTISAPLLSCSSDSSFILLLLFMRRRRRKDMRWWWWWQRLAGVLGVLVIPSPLWRPFYFIIHNLSAPHSCVPSQILNPSLLLLLSGHLGPNSCEWLQTAGWSAWERACYGSKERPGSLKFWGIGSNPSWMSEAPQEAFTLLMSQS